MAKKKKIKKSTAAVPQPKTVKASKKKVKKTKRKIPTYKGIPAKWQALVLLACLVISMLLYHKTLSFGYVLDDKIVYTDNSQVKDGWQGIQDIFSTESFTGYFGDQKNLVQGARYRPLSLATFNLEYHMFLRAEYKAKLKAIDNNPNLSQEEKKSAQSALYKLRYSLNRELKAIDNYKKYSPSDKQAAKKALIQKRNELKTELDAKIKQYANFSHLINILIYALTGWLIFLTLARLLREKVSDWGLLVGGIALGATLLFLAHPLHVEAVANVKGRDEILSFLFSLMAFWSALRYMDSPKLGLGWLLLSILSFFTGLLAKENTLTFLAIIPFGVFLFRKESRIKLGVIFTSLLITSIVYLMVRYSVIGYLINEAPSTDIMNNSFAGMTGHQKYATIGYTLLEYLKLNFIPHPLTHDYYPYHIPISSFGDLRVLLSMAAHVGLVGLMIYFWKRHKLLTFAIGYYFATMSIVSNLVISIGTFMNERFAFAASLGACMVLAYLISTLVKKKTGSKPALILLAVVVGVYSLLTLKRVPAWESELMLNTAAIKVSKNSARANSFMATALFNKFKETTDQGERKRLLLEAQPFAEKAVTIHPSYYNGNLMKVGIAAELHKIDRDVGPLLVAFHEAGAIRPDIDFLEKYLGYINGTEDKNQLIAFYAALANTLMDDYQRYDWAVKYLLLGLEVDFNQPELRSLIRKAYTGLGQLDEANRYR